MKLWGPIVVADKGNSLFSEIRVLLSHLGFLWDSRVFFFFLHRVERSSMSTEGPKPEMG